MQLLGLGHCRDTLVGDGGLMLRGISGGERKRLTTAEMVVGPQRVLLMDEISTGLDSATLHSVITFFTSVRTGRWLVLGRCGRCPGFCDAALCVVASHALSCLLLNG